jgi:uncharacterized protein HemX
MSKLARALSLAAMLAVMQLAMATVAHAQTTDRQAEVAWRARLAASQQPPAPGDATLRRVLAREGPSAANTAPTPATSPSMPPAAEHGGQGPALWALATVLALAAGVAVLVGRRAHRTHRAGQTA